MRVKNDQRLKIVLVTKKAIKGESTQIIKSARSRTELLLRPALITK